MPTVTTSARTTAAAAISRSAGAAEPTTDAVRFGMDRPSTSQPSTSQPNGSQPSEDQPSGLSTDLLAWQRQAACRGLKAEIFFPSESDEVAEDEAAFAAKAVCAVCAVSGDCLEYALAVREKEGVWGGQTAAERVRIIRRRRRAAARARNAQAVARPAAATPAAAS